MIDKEMFLQGMAQLGGAFGREVDGPVQRMYFAVIGPKLTNEEWQRAIADTVATETFWPSPAVILAKAGKDAESQAAAAWASVRAMMDSTAGGRFATAEQYRALGPTTLKALAEIGGVRAIAECSDERWANLVKRFSKAYVETINPHPAIGTGESPDPRVKKLASGVARQLSLVGGRDRQVKESGDE